MAVLPLFMGTPLVVTGFVSAYQMVVSFVFFFKFTYQRCMQEYIVFIGIFIGVVSAVENIAETIFGFPYLFTAEIGSVFFFLSTNNFLSTLL
ncbi:unnamed protein product [Sphagnum balticum]